MYILCILINELESPVNDKSQEFIEKFENKMFVFSFNRKLSSDFYCVLWFKAKYNHPDDLYRFIDKYKNLWQTDTFLRRQVTAILSRLLITNSVKVEKLLYNQISSGITNTVTLANQILSFSDFEKSNSRLNFLFISGEKAENIPVIKISCFMLSFKRRKN